MRTVAQAKQASAVGMAIAMLVEYYQVSEAAMTPARMRIYEGAFRKLNPALLRPMVDRCIETRKVYGKDKLPTVSDLLEDAEYCRQQIVAANPYRACEQCNRVGWLSVKRAGWQKPEYARCECYALWQAQLAVLGATDVPLVEAAAEERRMLAAGADD